MMTKEPKEMSSYVRDYTVPSTSLMSRSSIEMGVTLCVVASTILGFIINPIIGIAQQTVSISSFVIV